MNQFSFEFREVRMIPMSALRLDPRFNREIIPWTVNTIAEDPDPNKFGVLMVASVNGDGTYWIYDGQHRFEYLRGQGYDGEVPCMIGDIDDEHELARTFVFLNNTRRAVNVWERYKKLLFAEDPAYVEIDRAVRAVGWTVGPQALEFVVSPSPLFKLSDVGGGQHIERTLGLARDAWDGQPKCTDGNILQGLGGIIATLGATLDRDRLLDRLQASDPSEILSAAKSRKGRQGGGIAKNVQAEVMRAYRARAAVAA